MLSNTAEKRLAKKALAAKGYISFAVQFEIYQPSDKTGTRRYRNLPGRITKQLSSLEDVQRAKQVVRDALEGL